MTLPRLERDAGGRDRDLPGAVGDRADRAAPRVVRGEKRGRVVGVGVRDDDGEAAAHVEDLPHLRVGDSSEVADEGADRRDGERVGDLEADVGVEAREVEEPPTGDVGEAVDREAGAHEVEDGSDVDDGRLEQGVGDGGAAEGVRSVVECEAGERLAGE
jgi:hypothetical protein